MSGAEVAAVYELERLMHRAAAGRFERTASGFVTAAPSLPDVWDASIVQTEPDRDQPSLEQLLELVELPSQWYPELRHRTAFLGDVDAGRELAMSLARQGWDLSELWLLVIRQAPRARPRGTQQIDGNAMRRLKGRLGVEQGLPPRATAQFDRYDTLRERVASRAAFTALDETGKPAAIADSYLRGDIAVIEDVATLRRQRRRGLASAAVMAAVSNAIGLGARAVALFAEPEVARAFYGPLGFEAIGGSWDCKLGPPGHSPLRRD
jgi:GNAT superfamily N-acetyltransferase